MAAATPSTTTPTLSVQGLAEIKAQNAIRLGDIAPDFKADSSQGEISFHKYIDGKWAILFSHPKDFTPVCTTELGRVAQLKDEWAKRNVVVLALSVDNAKNHEAWIADINEIGKTNVYYPIIADSDRKISVAYGMLDQFNITEGMPVTVRSVFIIGPDKRIKLMLTYPASTGRNFDEILRCVDSLQLTADKKVATPSDWKRGQQCIVLTSMDTKVAAEVFGSVTEIKPYLRWVPDPSTTAK